MDKQYCTRCDKVLQDEHIVWLELDSYTGRYTKPGDEPTACSQGVYPFGAACARRQLKEDSK